MLGIWNLFGRSPFAPLESHMEKVSKCVELVPTLFDVLLKKDFSKVKRIAKEIEEEEHLADRTKHEIRNHLLKNIVLPINRERFLEILTIQDCIADQAQDVAVLVTIQPIEILEEFKKEFHAFLDKTMDTFFGARQIMMELRQLLESSFGGIEAEKVQEMVHKVAFKEHETDLKQRVLLKSFLLSEKKLTLSSFYLWQKIFDSLAAISNLSENLANSIRMTLELK